MCPWMFFDNRGFDKTDLAEGKMNGISNLPWPIDASAVVKKKDGNYISTDLMNSTQLLNNFNVTFDQTWTLYCRVIFANNDSCWPCLTFNAPKVKGHKMAQVINNSHKK